MTWDRHDHPETIEMARAILASVDERRARDAAQKATLRGRLGRWLLRSEQRSRAGPRSVDPWPARGPARR
jgi:hypothetical protein